MQLVKNVEIAWKEVEGQKAQMAARLRYWNHVGWFLFNIKQRAASCGQDAQLNQACSCRTFGDVAKVRFSGWMSRQRIFGHVSTVS